MFRFVITTVTRCVQLGINASTDLREVNSKEKRNNEVTKSVTLANLNLKFKKSLINEKTLHNDVNEKSNRDYKAIFMKV